MEWLAAALEQHARARPQAVALQGVNEALSYALLPSAIDAAGATLRHLGARRIGILADNNIAWPVVDLAAHAAQCVVVPLPMFFSDAQIAHALEDAGVDTVLTDQPARVASALEKARARFSRAPAQVIASAALASFRIDASAQALPPATAKITYTSGTTGAPKGVCLSAVAMRRVAVSLLERVGEASVRRHVSVLPLAVLLENIAGVYLPLLAGATCHLWPLASLGLRGSSGIDAAMMADTWGRLRATSTVLMPQMVTALLGVPNISNMAASMRFMATGGAPIASATLDHAQRIGLPVYEGYGLSECASVVALNTPDGRRIGSVGRPLPHARLRVAADGELWVSGAVCEGYVGSPSRADANGFWPTGDLARVDAAGFLRLTGRKKHMFITAFGRNVAPEWVEAELAAEPAIAQAAVFGEARPCNTAVIVARGRATRHEIERAIQAANARLPDYARVCAWIAADAPFSVENGQYTGNGRLRRASVWSVYARRIDEIYDQQLAGA